MIDTIALYVGTLLGIVLTIAVFYVFVATTLSYLFHIYITGRAEVIEDNGDFNDVALDGEKVTKLTWGRLVGFAYIAVGVLFTICFLLYSVILAFQHWTPVLF